MFHTRDNDYWEFHLATEEQINKQMKDLILNKEEFKLFNQFDQFGFFYSDDGFPKDDADETFDSDVDGLFQTYGSILVDSEDNVFGYKNGLKELIFESVSEAYSIAMEVKER